MYKKTELGVDAFQEGGAQIEFCGKLEIRASCKLCVCPVLSAKLSADYSSSTLVRSETRKLRLALEGDRRPPLALYYSTFWVGRLIMENPWSGRGESGSGPLIVLTSTSCSIPLAAPAAG